MKILVNKDGMIIDAASNIEILDEYMGDRNVIKCSNELGSYYIATDDRFDYNIIDIGNKNLPDDFRFSIYKYENNKFVFVEKINSLSNYD